MKEGLRIRLLVADDAAALLDLRREALSAHPLAFSATAEDDLASSIEAARKSVTMGENAVIFGAFAAEELVGMLGAYRAEKVKRRHQVTIWGMFVRPAVRRGGGGRHLMEAVLEWARAFGDVTQVRATVAESAVEAQALYLSVGFHEWGHEPRALQWQGQFTDHLHLVLELPAPGG